MGDFVDDELPLPSFVEVFGDGHPDMILVTNNAAAARRRLANKRTGSRLGAGDESSGRWTPEEQKLFLEGLMLYGKDWKKMAPLIKTRTLVQIRTHAQKVFKKMGLRMLNHSRRKRGIDDEDDIDEERLDQLKQSGQLEGMIASGELNVVDGDDNERNRSNALGEVMHPNAHLNPLVSAVRLPVVGIGNPPGMPSEQGAAPSVAPLASSAPAPMAVRMTPGMPIPQQPQVIPPNAAPIMQQQPYMLPAPVQPPVYHQMMLQQQVAMQQQQQQQEYLRQQQQFILHQQMQQDEYNRQRAYQQQQGHGQLYPPQPPQQH